MGEGTGTEATVLDERRHLLGVAYRMLGTLAEAEDAVQEAYIRWYRLTDADRAAIETPRAWLTTATSRICMNMLTSARSRRERYIGPWLPEPVPGDTFSSQVKDPADQASLDDTVSTALLVVLESMTPAERVAFVLHDVFAVPFDEIAETVGRSPAACRQLAASARRHVQASRARDVPRNQHDSVVRAFAAACRTGDLPRLISVLDPDVTLKSDGGGVVTAARNPVTGADRVARFLLGALTQRQGIDVVDRETSDGLGFVLWEHEVVIGVVNLRVSDGGVTEVWMVLNPSKLTLWKELDNTIG